MGGGWLNSALLMFPYTPWSPAGVVGAGSLRYFGATMNRPHLAGLLPEDLVRHLAADGTNATVGEARRVLAHAMTHSRNGFPTARPVAAVVARAVEATTRRDPLQVIERVADPGDGFVKYLFAAPDQARWEAVRIPLDAPRRFTICLSCQVGCAMGCAFCATGRLGLNRNLAAWEMVETFRTVRDEAPGRVTGAVFQGEGEPLANYDAVIQAARILSHPCGGRISARAISLSTVGLAAEIRRFAVERHPYRLILSLTSAIGERRAALLPAARRCSLPDLADAWRTYQRAVGGRVTVAWVVLGGVNTGEDEVEALAAWLGDLPVKLNLIDVNDPRPDGFRRASEEELNAFRDHLAHLKVPVVRRYSGGAAIHAACGMLAGGRKHLQLPRPPDREIWSEGENFLRKRGNDSVVPKGGSQR